MSTAGRFLLRRREAEKAQIVRQVQAVMSAMKKKIQDRVDVVPTPGGAVQKEGFSGTALRPRAGLEIWGRGRRGRRDSDARTC